MPSVPRLARPSAALAVALLAVASFTHVASAEEEVGASGQCFEGDAGGSDKAAVRTDGSVVVPSGTGAAAGVVTLVTSEGTCSGYLEAHAGSTQLCWNGQVRLGGCPTTPTRS